MDQDLILEIIKNGKETNLVDFKQEFYIKLRESDLPKDVSSFANSTINENKYIIFGVEDKTHQVVGVDVNSLPSQDDLDDYLSSTVEPFIHTEINYFEYSENVFVTYIKIMANNRDFPYVIKKTCGKNNSIQEGDIFIRKGTIIRKASRADLEQMQTKNGAVLLKIRDSLICIEPIKNADTLTKEPTYGYFDLEIYNDTPKNILLDAGEISISTDKHKVQRNIVSILPKLAIRNNPIEISAGSRKVYTCLFDFMSQDCVDFGFSSDGWMQDYVNIQVSLFDTDNNEYQSETMSVTLRAKGDILHKVRLKERIKKKKHIF